MRMTLSVLAGVVLGAGVSMTPGRPPSVDMVSARLSSALPSPTHVGHWLAPAPGRPVFITANVMEAGSGAGDVTLGVLVVGTGTVCTLTMPCTTVSGGLPSQDCPSNAISPGAEVHLEYSHTCTSAPHGNAVFGFEWAR